MVLAALAWPAAARAQIRDSVRAIRPADVAAVVAGAAAYLAPDVLGITGTPSNCAPCNRASVPTFDRWAIVAPRSTWDLTSTGLFFGLAGAAGLDLLRRGPQGFNEVVAMADAGAVAMGTTQLLKVIVNRKRPIFYTSDAASALGVVEDRHSMPSGHATAAFAVAMSYWLARRDLAGGHAKAAGWIALATAAGVGVLRVVAGKHFPSDVAAGAAIGVGSALVVHAIKF